MPRSTSRSTAANHNAGARKKPFLPELAVVSCKFPNFSAFTQQPLNSYDSKLSILSTRICKVHHQAKSSFNFSGGAMSNSDANRCFALKFCQGSVLLNDSISLLMGAKHGCLSPWSLLIRLIPKDLRLCRPRCRWCRGQHDSAMTVKTCWHSEPPHLASKQSSRKARRPKSQINRDVLYCFDVLCLVMHCVDQPSKQHGFL